VIAIATTVKARTAIGIGTEIMTWTATHLAQEEAAMVEGEAAKADADCRLRPGA
jgi:hypothetical protein